MPLMGTAMIQSTEFAMSRLASKQELENIYYRMIPKARRINPFFRESFELLYECSVMVRSGKLLNIYSSNDLSGQRESCLSELLFASSDYYTADFWEDMFIDFNGKKVELDPGNYTLPVESGQFDAIITTKVILEHVSNPTRLIEEFNRLLKPGGRIYLIAPHIRRQHQKPYDFFRFTEFALDYMLSENGFENINIRHCGGYAALVGYYGYFIQRGLNVHSYIKRLLDIVHYNIFEPLCFAIDKLDNGYGRDITMYFMVRASKEIKQDA